MDEGGTIPRDYIIEALDKGLRVLFALGVPQYIELTVNEIAESTEMNKNMVFRILKTLERRQLVEEIDGKWRLAPALTRFSQGYTRSYEERLAELDREKKDHLG